MTRRDGGRAKRRAGGRPAPRAEGAARGAKPASPGDGNRAEAEDDEPGARVALAALDRFPSEELDVPLDSLLLDPDNARVHPEANVDAIRASLARFGQVERLVVQRSSGRIIGGNGRAVAMRALGMTRARALLLDVDDATAAQLGLALNRTADLATWDQRALARLLAAMPPGDARDATGFDAQDVAKILAAAQPPEAPASFPVVDGAVRDLHQCPKCGYEWTGTTGPRKQGDPPAAAAPPKKRGRG